jgi:hypothetical protein
MPSPPQHSLCGVGVSASLPVRNVAHVIRPASGVTQSVGDEGGDAAPGMPGKPGSGACCLPAAHGGEPPGAGGADGDGGVSLPAGTDGGDSLPEGGGESLPRGKPGNPLGLRLVPGNQSTRLSARCLLNASAGCCSTAAITAAVTTTSKTTLLRFDAAIATFLFFPTKLLGSCTKKRRSNA